MNDCYRCPVEKDCHYPHKVCDCVDLRKFWSADRRRIYDKLQSVSRSLLTMTSEEYNKAVEIAIRS